VSARPQLPHSEVFSHWEGTASNCCRGVCVGTRPVGTALVKTAIVSFGEKHLWLQQVVNRLAAVRQGCNLIS